ncbi:MAG: tyrosine-protein phosphatase, partial [Dysgonamonadaceae bacterium]|nr:tyrosine-protein phosphatase [Dysgonamonadaceae bacterium]
MAYRHFALGHKHIFKAIFKQIDPAKDIFLIHCHAGKDRTGCIVALLGLLVGETMENIM